MMFGQSKEPVQWTIEANGPEEIVDGSMVRLQHADGRYLRSDGRESKDPEWETERTERTLWRLNFEGNLSIETKVQIESLDNGDQGAGTCICNDLPAGGYGGRKNLRGKHSYSTRERDVSWW